MSLERTPSQTIGPFFAVSLLRPEGPLVVDEDTPGAVWIRGRVLDGDGRPVPDALVETWQSDLSERPSSVEERGPVVPGWFRGFGRCPTDADGEWAILTVKPGGIARDGVSQAPHLEVFVFARGLLKALVTRMYFRDESEANEADPVLRTLTDEDRDTLLAESTDDGYRFDMRLQGEGETVFFDV